MSADSDLDVQDLDLSESEQRLVRSLERAKQPFVQKTTGLMIGLTTGHFDCNSTVSYSPLPIKVTIDLKH